MFPHHVIARLRDARGEQWARLVDRVSQLPETHEEVLAFMLMMVHANGCLPCETDSYRAMRGCTACAQQTLRRFKGTDDDLMQMYQAALDEIRAYLGEHSVERLGVFIAEAV